MMQELKEFFFLASAQVEKYRRHILMEVKNCKACKKLFNVVSNEVLCPSCLKKLEEKFQEVKKYVDENPNSSVEVVAEATKVPTKQIRKWVREERLIFAEGGACGIECEQCGAMIRTGRYCESCKAAIKNNLMSALNKPKAPEPVKRERDGNKMRFISN